MLFPKNPSGVGFLFSFLVFPSCGGAFTKRRCRGREKPFSEKDVSTASCRRAGELSVLSVRGRTRCLDQGRVGGAL